MFSKMTGILLFINSQTIKNKCWKRNMTLSPKHFTGSFGGIQENDTEVLA